MDSAIAHESRSTLAAKLERSEARVVALEERIDAGSAGWDEVLRAHRGAVRMDRRYHCVCGWVSGQLDDRTHAVLGQPDVRAHLVDALRGAL